MSYSQFLHQALKIRTVLMACAVVAAVVAVGFAHDATAAVRGIDMAKDAQYNGTTISRESAASKNLSCIEGSSGQMTCFDTMAELESSSLAAQEAAKSEGGSVGSISRKANKPKARASADCRLPADAMVITENTDFNYRVFGWQIVGYARQNWYNMTGGYANSASAVSAGNHSGYLADRTNGGSTRVRVEVNECEEYLSRRAFNDRAESRYRN